MRVDVDQVQFQVQLIQLPSTVCPPLIRKLAAEDWLSYWSYLIFYSYYLVSMGQF